MCGNKFWLPNGKSNALILPFPSPQACAGNKRIILFAHVLYHSIVTGSHQWKIATHVPMYTLHHTDIEWLIFFVTKDQTAQLGNIFCILWSRPTLKKSPT